jgi:N6-adenosine-specific RNA methylase IME4
VKYRTIVADPPWAYDEGWPVGPEGRRAAERAGVEPWARTSLDYPSLSVPEIMALPVGQWAEADAHLYLWTTNRYLFDARAVAEAWGFRYSQLLVWAKTPMGKGPGGAFAQNAEYVLFCRRGRLPYREKQDSVWFNWRRMGKAHSRKPEAFIDLVEQVSPGPYLEMFARRARFGWDY